jgi:hypothetical protein
LTAKRGRSEQRVIRQLDRDGVEISIERAVRIDPEHAATDRIFQSVDVDIVEHEVRGGRVRPYINRIVVAAEQPIRAEVEALFPAVAVDAFREPDGYATKRLTLILGATSCAS